MHTKPLYRIRIGVIGLFLLLFPTLGFAQTSTFSAEVHAHATGEPLAGVHVVVGDPSRGAVTDAAGRVRIQDVPAGTHMVTFSLLGYATELMAIEFSDGVPVKAEVGMLIRAIEIEPLTIRAERLDRGLVAAGYYDRKATGFGTFIDGERMEQLRERGSLLSTGLRGVPGIRVVPKLRGSGYTLQSSRGPVSIERGCFPDIYLDGVRMPPDFDFDLDLMTNMDEIEAIEVYAGPAEAPMRFSNACAAVLLWTRRY